MPDIIKVHGPYEDAIIAVCELFSKIVDGQDAATKKELWSRYLDATAPLHNALMDASKTIEKFFKGN